MQVAHYKTCFNHCFNVSACDVMMYAAVVRDAEVETYCNKMFAGKHMNASEDHAVLYVTLRDFNDFQIQEAPSRKRSRRTRNAT